MADGEFSSCIRALDLPSEAAGCPPAHPQPRGWMMLQDPALGCIMDIWALSSDEPNADAFTLCTCDPFFSLIIFSLQSEISESI